MSEPMTHLESYESLRYLGLQAVQAGRLEEAFDAFDRAWQCACEQGDQQLVDRAYCNRSLVAIELDRAEDAVSRLREILLRNQDGENCRLAAYHVARAYELAKDYKKGLFYARLAFDRSREIDRADWLASSHNQIGDLLLAESHTEQATHEYQAALDLLDDEPSVRRAQILDNLGYCRILDGRIEIGFRLLYQSLRTLRRFGAGRYAVSTHLDLCYAYLEVERTREALRHGRFALAGAREFAMDDSEKNALYLLGQSAALGGDLEAAREYFGELEAHFPGTPYLTDFLLAVDVRQLINLKA